MKLPLWFCFYSSSFFGKFSFQGRYVPNRALETDQVLDFDINTSVKEECKLSPPKYFVKKIQRINSMGKDQLVFHAAKYESFSLGISPQPNFPTDPTDDDHIAIVECTRGGLDWVFTKPAFRGCGIAKVMSALCMFEPQFHLVRARYYSFSEKKVITQKNKVLVQLRKHNKKTEVEFLQKCIRLIGLYNIVKSGAGFGYLSAAHLTGYQWLVVHRYDKTIDMCGGEFLKYKLKQVLEDQAFSFKTGLIYEKEGTGYDSRWYFCKRWS